MRTKVLDKIKLTVTKIAESAGATAEVIIENKTPVTYNDPQLTDKMVASLERAAGKENLISLHAVTGAEDFGYYEEKVPGLFFFVGAMPADIAPDKAPSHHTPDFMLDERGFLTGLKAMLNVTTDYMFAKK